MVGLGHGPATRPARATRRPYDTASKGHDTVDPRARACDIARSWPSQGEIRDTKLCIVAEGRPCVAIQCSQGLRYGAQRPATRHRGAATLAAAHATRCALGLRVAIQFLYRDRGA